MPGEIKVDTAAFEAQSAILQGAIEAFEPFVTAFSTDAFVLSGNSDFYDKFNDALRSMANDVAPELLTDIKDYAQKVATLATTFRELDDEMARSLEGGD
jgi:hypothetical protein